MTVIPTTPAQREALRQRFADLLLGAEVSRIRFRYGAFELRPGGYVVIAASLATRGATVSAEHADRRPMNVRVERMPDGVGAMYRARTNTIAVPSTDYGQSVAQRAAVVHESTHAIFDYNRVRLSALEEEACAYIAGAMYRIMLHDVLGVAASAHFVAAQQIAEGLVAPHRLMRPYTDEVTTAQMQTLTAAIRASPTYADIAARRASYRYRHDGGTI